MSVEDAEGDIAGAAGDIQHADRAGGAEPVDHGGFPQPVDAARHQVVHQVVAAGDRFEDAADQPHLVAYRHAAEAEMGLVSSILARICHDGADRSDEHTSELQSLMRTSYAVFCLKKKKTIKTTQ